MFGKRKTKFGVKESTSASAQSSALMKSEAEEVVMAKWRSRSAWSPHQRPGDVSAEGWQQPRWGGAQWVASVELYSKGIWRLCREEDGAWDVHTGLLGREPKMRSTHHPPGRVSRSLPTLAISQVGGSLLFYWGDIPLNLNSQVWIYFYSSI